MQTDITTVSTERLDQLFGWLERTGSATEAFAVEQAPLLAEEILRMHAAADLFASAILMLAVIVCFGVSSVLFWVGRARGWDMGSHVGGLVAFVVSIIGAVAVIGWIAATISASYKVYEANNAPRMVVTKWVADQLN